MDNLIELLAKKIQKDVFIPLNTHKTTIFLCGAASDATDSIRGKIAAELTSFRNAFKYDIIYPEDIFEGLIPGDNSTDLLSLENILAESVDAIVIVPESPGALTELGAFANDENLRDKIICLSNQKYKKKNSFINYGPIQLLRKKSTKGSVIFYSEKKFSSSLSKLKTSINKLKKRSSKMPSYISLIQLENYLLPTIYLMEPVSKNVLEEMVSHVSPENVYQKTTAALTMLTKKNLLTTKPSGYCLTNSGIKKFNKLKKAGKHKTNIPKNNLDSIRLDILNWMYRNKKLVA